MERWVIGIDEVGRGPLAGPVYVCAVAIPETLYRKMKWKGLTDSKLMTPKARTAWYEEALVLKRDRKIKIALAFRSAKAIDQKGIAVCISECVTSVLSSLALSPENTHVLLDGSLKAPMKYVHQKTIIKGDQKEKIISLASVVAKVTRDRVMDKMHALYPNYDWYKNKGYGTRDHIKALKIKGLSAEHRNSFLRKILDK